jgi:hypothetical protein
MAFRYDEPIRAEGGVLFRVHDHTEHSFLFKVEKPALEALYESSLSKLNPIDPADRGYPSQHVFRHVNDRKPFDAVDAYNHHRERIHQVALALLAAHANGDPITITTAMLNG